MQASGLVSTFAGFCSTHACMPAIIDGFAPGRRGAVLLRPDHEVSRRLRTAARKPSPGSGGGWRWVDGDDEAGAGPLAGAVSSASSAGEAKDRTGERPVGKERRSPGSAYH